MRDRVPRYPGRVKLTPVSGQANVYDMTRADSPTQEGDPINKSTLLKNSTAALYGLGDDATPNDVFAEIRNYVEATLNVPAGTEDPATLLDNLLDEYIATKRDKSVGYACYVTSVTHPVLAGNSYILKINVISQNYVSLEAISYGDNPSHNVAKKFTRSKYNGVWGEWSNEDRVETGSYTGTGTYGSKEPNSLTFSFKPKLFLISIDETQLLFGNSYGNSSTFGYICGALTESYTSISVGRQGTLMVKLVDKTVYWYETNGGDAGTQLNNSGTVYNYIAIG